MNHKEMRPGLGCRITTGNSESILAGLYRDVIGNMIPNTTPGNDPRKSQKMMALFILRLDRYIKRTYNADNLKESSSMRNNLEKELMSTNISWKVFMQGLDILNVKSLGIRITLHIKGGQVKTVGIVADLANPNDILSVLFSEILSELKIGSSLFDQYLTRYIKSERGHISAKDISSSRGNLKKELLREGCSWKIFIKGLVFLGVLRFDFSLALGNGLGSYWPASVSNDISNTIMGRDEE